MTDQMEERYSDVSMGYCTRKFYQVFRFGQEKDYFITFSLYVET